jgi:hypothetical protein
MIQEVEIDWFRARTAVSIGPARHLAPGELQELLSLFRYRTVYDNPNLRVSAEDNIDASGTVGGDTAIENTTAGNPPLSLHVVAAPVTE